ncbi:MAG: hypothetical protein FWC89_09570 [Defluviitaleaceae bacterium]|nr:hypothetical protein [Defluviitaleaceae bacterium]
MSEEKLVQLMEEVLKRQLEPVIAKLSNVEAKVDRLETEVAEIKETQNQHTRLLKMTANAIERQTDNLMKHDVRIQRLEREVFA